MEVIKRLVGALKTFPSLEDIVVHNARREKPSEEEGNSFAEMSNNQNLQRKCLRPSKWNGTFEIAIIISPPTHWISDLFIALTETDI